MSIGQGQAPQPRRLRVRPPGSPNGFSPIGGGADSPLGPPPVGQSQGDGAMGMYRNAILRRMQGTAGGMPPVGGPMPGMQPQGVSPLSTPGVQQAQEGSAGVQGLIQNLMRTRNSRRVLGGASGPLGQ